MSLTSQTKIIKQNPTRLELKIAQVIFDLQSASDADLSKKLKELYIVGAKEIKIGERRAIIVFVPYPKLVQFQAVHNVVVSELEKKFAGKHVMLLAQRRILNKITKKNRTKRQKRPMSRTLSAVHNAILEDLVFPAQIVDKRIRVRVDGTRLFKVSLDPAKKSFVEDKLETFTSAFY